MRCPICGYENPEGMTFCGKCAARLDAPSESEHQQVSLSSDFVGRQQEMAELVSALDDALAGHGRLVMLVGEPGIGKTRTTQELAAIAESKGAQVLWGRCYEGEGAPPYWPWVQPIRAYVQQAVAEQLRSEMGRGAADIAEIVPEVKDKLPDLEPSPALDSLESARFRLFDSITSFLKRASQTRPLMLVLEDLHWADRSSLLLLEFLAHELGESSLLVIGTYRDVELSRQHPLSESLAQLSRESTFQRVLLRGLGQEDTGSLIEVSGGITPSPELTAVVHARTEGNPFFINEVTSLLERGEKLAGEQEELAIGIPEGVREVIGRRLNQLSHRCNETLTIASVIGREFELRQLNKLIDDATEDMVLDVLEEGLSTRVIEELPTAVGRYQFTHALIQETLVEELSLTRRVRLHARIAEMLEELYGDNVEAHAAELAHHFAQAEAMLGTEKMVHYSHIAGERALAANAFEEALSHLERALAAMQRQPMDSEAAAILFGLGWAQLAMNQLAEAMSSLRNVFDYFIESGDVGLAVAIAEHPHSSEFIVGMGEVISRAVELVPPDSHEAGRILCNYGYALGYTREGYTAAQEAFDRALVIARRLGDTTLEMRTLANSANIDAHHLRWDESLEKSLKAIELGRLVDDPHARMRAHVWASSSLFVMGEPDKASSHARELVATAEALRDRRWLARSMVPNMTLAALRGNWEIARESSDRGLSVAPRESRLVCGRVVMEYELGESDVGEAYLQRLLELSGAPGNRDEGHKACATALVNRITGGIGRIGLAEAAAEGCITSPSSVPGSIYLARMGLALVAVDRRDSEAAREQYIALEPRKGEVSLSIPVCYDRVLGLLSQTMGNLDDAQTHFEDALALCRKAGYRPELAWSLHDYADMLLERNAPGDRAKVLSLLDEALIVSTELGMRPLIERVVTLKNSSETQPAKTSIYPDGLTPREVEVLRLIALGRSNQDIANELFISLNTVTRHISNIFSKTGSSNRAEAATYATRQGMV